MIIDDNDGTTQDYFNFFIEEDKLNISLDRRLLIISHLLFPHNPSSTF